MKEKQEASKIKTIIISVIAAIFVWAAVTYINPPELTTTISNLPVRFTGEEQLHDRGLTVVDRASMPSLSVAVKGKKNDLLSLSGGIYVEVDVSTVSEEGEFELAGNVTLPSAKLTIESVKFSSVPVQIEAVSSKDIPIRIAQTGEKSGRLVKTVSADEFVTITGAKSELEEVAYGEATVDISDASNGEVIEAGYVLKNSSNALIVRNETISASRTRINVQCSLYNAVVLPVKAYLSGSMAEEYVLSEDDTVITPSTIEVGLRDMTIREVKLYIDAVTNEFEGVLTEEEGMYIPEAAKRVKVKPVIDKKTTKSINVTVNAKNTAAGLNARIEALTVTASGAADKLTAANINASVDLSGLGSGTYTVPVTVTGKGVTIDGAYTVSVTIS